MAKIISLRKFFKPTEKPYSFKRCHYLNQIATHRLEEILLFSEGDYLSALWPSFEKKKVLFFNDQKHKYIFKRVITDEPGYLVNYVYRGTDLTEQRAGYHTVIGDTGNLSIRRKHFDVVICPFALEDGPFIEGFIKKLAECLDNGSRLILSLRHPQLDNILCNQNPSSTHVAESQVSKYHALLKKHDLYVEEIREGGVDLALKAFFTDSEYDYYHEYKNTPISLLFRAVKFTRKTPSL